VRTKLQDTLPSNCKNTITPKDKNTQKRCCNNSDSLRATEPEPRRSSITSINNQINNKLYDNQKGEKIDLDEISVLRISVYDEAMNLTN